jgi:MoaA/NifB/PqqE/SkfB family radical SAM enzyme
MGFKVNMVTNGYWATSEDDAEFWLEPLKELQIANLSISDDTFHNPEGEDSPAQRGLRAARKLGLPVGSICIEPPVPQCPESGQTGKGQPVLGGNVRFRGRAVDTMAADLPTRPWKEFCECPHEELVSPSRLHVDPFGYLHVCQGLTIGNIQQTPLRDVIGNYDAQRHPVCGPLVRGGPAGLATELGLDHADEYVDACHFCYVMRRALIDRYPECLAPRQVYGLQPPGTDAR